MLYHNVIVKHIALCYFGLTLLQMALIIGNMQVIDISSRLFTKQNREELTDILRRIAHEGDIATEEFAQLKVRAGELLKKAGGPEKFFTGPNSSLKDILDI